MDISSLRSHHSVAPFIPPSIVGVLSFALYLLTLCPTVYVGDSAEFITNAATLGINHPTGYPLYTLLGRLVAFLVPLVSAAVAVNLLSAVAATGSVICVYYILHTLTSRNEVASAAALLFACSQTLWGRATTAEVYALNAFFVAAALLFVLRWDRSNDTRFLLLTAYIIGFGLSQHITGAIAALGIVLFVLLTRPRVVQDIRLVLALTGLVMLGFTTYLYLPLRSMALPPLDWGNPGFIEKLGSHLYPVGPKGIGAFFGDGGDGRVSWVIERLLFKEFWYFGILGLVGAGILTRQWKVLTLFVLIVAGNLVFSLSRKLPLHADFDAYIIPTILVFAILAGVALGSALTALELRLNRAGTIAARWALHVFLFALPTICLLSHFQQSDRSSNTFGRDFGMNLLAPVEQNAIVFTLGDEQTFFGWYAKYLEKSRPDISVVDVRLLGSSWGAKAIFERDLHLPFGAPEAPEELGRRIINTFIAQRPLYFTHRLPWSFLLKEYDVMHTGMLIRLLKKGDTAPYRPSAFAMDSGWSRTELDERCQLLVNFYPKEYLDNAQFWFGRLNNEAAQRELDGFFSLPFSATLEDNVTGLLLQSLILGRSEQTSAAVKSVDSALTLDPANWRGYEYRGNFRFAEGDSADALADWEKSLSLNPTNQNVLQNIQLLRKTAPRPRLSR